MLRKKRKWHYINSSIKIKKGRKRVDKNRNREHRQQIERVTNMVDIGSTISIFTLKVSGLN